MASTLGRFPRPEAQQYRDKRKLFVVPIFLLPPDPPRQGRDLLERYWSEVRDHVRRLESSLGAVTRVYHELVFIEGEEGLRLVEEVNPAGYSFVEALCKSTGHLEAVEDRELVEVSSDWQRCLAVGLVSRRVFETALEGYRQANEERQRRIARRIDETLEQGQAGVLFIREDHRVQFPADIQVFYVAPPSLDALRRWLAEQARPPVREDGGAQEGSREEQEGNGALEREADQ